MLTSKVNQKFHEEKMQVKSEPQTMNRCFTCLCLSDDCMQITSEPIDSGSVTVADLLAKHFWFQQDEFASAQHVICENCWKRLDDFHRFYQEVEENHRTLDQKPLEGCEPTEDFNGNGQMHFEIQIKEEDNWLQSEDEESDSEDGTVPSSSEQQNEQLIKPLPSVAKQEACKRKIGTNDQELDSFPNKRRRRSNRKESDEIINAHIQYNCTICKMNNFSFNGLRAHNEEVHKLKAGVMCCGALYTRKSYLTDHVLKLMDPNRFKCDICDRVLANSKQLLRHKHEVHVTAEEMKYSCHICSRRFVRVRVLRNHVRKHSNGMPFTRKRNACTQ